MKSVINTSRSEMKSELITNYGGDCTWVSISAVAGLGLAAGSRFQWLLGNGAHTSTPTLTGDRVHLIKMSGLTPEQKEMLKNEIKKVRLDAKNQEALEKIPLERLVENYIEMSVEIIKEMEQRNDPVFVEVLQYAQAHLTQEVEKNKPHLTLAQTFSRHIFSEFLSIQIEIYAACNKIAMQQCTPVDKIAHLAIFQEPPV